MPKIRADDTNPSASATTITRVEQQEHAVPKPPGDDHRRAEQRENRMRRERVRPRDLERATVVHERAGEELPRIELREQHADAAARSRSVASGGWLK